MALAMRPGDTGPVIQWVLESPFVGWIGITDLIQAYDALEVSQAGGVKCKALSVVSGLTRGEDPTERADAARRSVPPIVSRQTASVLAAVARQHLTAGWQARVLWLPCVEERAGVNWCAGRSFGSSGFLHPAPLHPAPLTHNHA